MKFFGGVGRGSRTDRLDFDIWIMIGIQGSRIQEVFKDSLSLFAIVIPIDSQE